MWYVGGGNCTAQGKCWYDEVSPTLKAFGTHAVAVIDMEKDRIIVLNDQGGRDGSFH